MAWRHPGDKPLSKPMIVNLPGYFWLADGCATNQSEAMLENPCSMNFNDFQSRSQKIHTITPTTAIDSDNIVDFTTIPSQQLLKHFVSTLPIKVFISYMKTLFTCKKRVSSPRKLCEISFYRTMYTTSQYLKQWWPCHSIRALSVESFMI